MTQAHRIIAVIDVGPDGRVPSAAFDDGLDPVALSREAADAGADEIWWRVQELGPRAGGELFEPIRRLKPTLFLPLVVWGPFVAVPDVRLLVSLGADRVVVDLERLPEPAIDSTKKLVAAAGADRLGIAMWARREMGAKRAWELTTKRGARLEDTIDALETAHRLVDAGVVELVMHGAPLDEGTGPHPIDVELVDRLTATLTVPLVVRVGDAPAVDPVELGAEVLLCGADALAQATVATPSGIEPDPADLKRAMSSMGVTVRQRGHVAGASQLDGPLL